VPKVPESILDKLANDSVVEVELLTDRTLLTVWEACDRYFYTVLSRDQVRQLANELLEIAETMNAQSS
jgi:hypothetical protein